ncbi:MAG: HAF repeat-containing protein [Acidobacteriaceae bacterium]|nr:HAF repeat-containing protein [Acidobacteriaceae bacterium]
MALRAILSFIVATVMLNHPTTAQVTNVNPDSDQPVLTNIGALPPEFNASQARGINTQGHVVGSLILREEANHAFLYRNGEMMDLGVLPSGTFSDAYAVNERDQVVGTALFSFPIPPGGRFFHAFIWDKGVMTDIGLLRPGGHSHAYAINNRGQVVGDAGDHAFLYYQGVMTDLGTLGGSTSKAVAINEAGAIVGNSTLADGSKHAFLYWQGVMTDLGTLGGANSIASSINNLGQIVGTSQLADGTSHGFLYQSGQMIDLTTLPNGQDISSAIWINDVGQILCDGFVYESGRVVSFSAPLPPDNLIFVFATQINNRGQIPGWILPIKQAGVLNINELAESQQ